MNRRKFIFRSLFLVCASAVVYLIWWWRAKLTPQDCTDVVEEVLRRRLDYLDLEPHSLRQFSDELQRSLDPYVRERLAKCSLFLPLYGIFDKWAMSGKMRASYLGLCEPIVTRYLLASGFFSDEGSPDLKEPIVYTSGTLSNPTICGNPWANLSPPV